MGQFRLGSFGSELGRVIGCCEQHYEPYNSTNVGNFLMC